MKLKILVGLLCFFFASESMAKDYDTKPISNPYDLITYQNSMSRGGDKKLGKLIEQKARLEMIKDFAEQAAMRAGMIHANAQINDIIESSSRQLDAIYNFEPLMIYGRVVPPVITEVRDIYNQQDSNQIRLSKQIYTIERQAYFSSTAPNWRSYLNVNYKADVYDNLAYLAGDLSPRTKEERLVWEKATLKGWEIGVRQAGIALEQKMKRLNRDYIGMIEFHKLVVQGKISMPSISSYELFDSNNGKSYVVDETLLRLDKLPEFQSSGFLNKGISKLSVSSYDDNVNLSQDEIFSSPAFDVVKQPQILSQSNQGIGNNTVNQITSKIRMNEDIATKPSYSLLDSTPNPITSYQSPNLNISISRTIKPIENAEILDEHK